MQSLTTSVIIIGAGPAGMGTSIYLSKAGIPHIIIDKAQFPRDKICGDGCSGKTAHVLRKANPEWLQEIFRNSSHFLPSKGIIFAAPDGKSLPVSFGDNLIAGETAPGFTSPRLVFDDFLFRKADPRFATIFQQTTINSISRENGQIQVQVQQGEKTLQLTAPLIVGADGDKSIVRKTLLPVHTSPKADSVGLRAYYKGVKGLNNQHYIELHFLKELLPGYFWIFPMPGGLANVGVGMPSERIRKKKLNLRTLMQQAIAENPTISARFADAAPTGRIQGWGLPMGIERLPVSGNNFILTGDAASLIDPFSGEGIGNALYSGMLAADAASSAIAQQRYDNAFLKENYDDALYRSLGAELQLSTVLQKLCRHPWLFNFLVGKATRSPLLGHTISSMFTDLNLRKQLRKPSFYLKILFNK